jgi:hypothetical protein
MASNQKDFWKSIGKLGISIERNQSIPWSVIDNEGIVLILEHFSRYFVEASGFAELCPFNGNNNFFSRNRFVQFCHIWSYCSEGKSFDRLNRKYRCKYLIEKQKSLEEKLMALNKKKVLEIDWKTLYF